MPSDARIVVGAISVARISEMTSDVPPIRIARPDDSTASMTPSSVDRQRVADAEREPGERSERDRGRVDLHGRAEQRDRADAGEGGDAAEHRHRERGERGAHEQHQDEEENGNGEQLGGARAVDGLALEGTVDRRLAGDVRGDRTGHGLRDRAVDLLLHGLDHLVLGA
jgi:hypothetical protein